MNEPKNIDLSSLEKVLSIGIVILVVAIVSAVVTGGGIYFWQRSVAAKEEQVLLEQIDKLQDEIKVLKEGKPATVSLPQVPVDNSKPVSKIEQTDKVYKLMLAGREQDVILALKNYDLVKLAGFVHPSKGVRFSPYSYIDPKQDLVFSGARIEKMYRDNGGYEWGYYDTTGLPIKLSFRDYFKSFIYDRDFANASEIGYNQSITNGIAAGNIFSIYPKAVVAEYRYSKADPNNQLADWRNLKLVFEKSNNNWYLVGIVHDQWLM